MLFTYKYIRGANTFAYLFRHVIKMLYYINTVNLNICIRFRMSEGTTNPFVSLAGIEHKFSYLWWFRGYQPLYLDEVSGI